MTDMRKSMQVRNDRNLMAEMDKVEKLINGLISFLKRTFQDFSTMSQDMWNNLTAAKFEQVKAYIESTQVKVGSVLCGLTVKMNAWVVKFPNPRSGGPGAKGEFIMTDMRQGLAETHRNGDLHGTDYLSLVGHKTFYANAQLRFPIVEAMLTPVGVVGGIRGNFFFDIGGAGLNGSDFTVFTNKAESIPQIADFTYNPVTGVITPKIWRDEMLPLIRGVAGGGQ